MLNIGVIHSDSIIIAQHRFKSRSTCQDDRIRLICLSFSGFIVEPQGQVCSQKQRGFPDRESVCFAVEFIGIGEISEIRSLHVQNGVSFVCVQAFCRKSVCTIARIQLCIASVIEHGAEQSFQVPHACSIQDSIRIGTHRVLPGGAGGTVYCHEVGHLVCHLPGGKLQGKDQPAVRIRFRFRNSLGHRSAGADKGDIVILFNITFNLRAKAHLDFVCQIKIDLLDRYDLVHCRSRRTGGQTARHDIVPGGERQLLIRKESPGFLVISIVQRTCGVSVDVCAVLFLNLFLIFLPGKDIAVIDIAFNPLQEQPPVPAYGTFIRVSDICQIVEAVVHMDDVPLVGTCPGSAAEHSGHRIDLDLFALELRQSAQVLEGL